MEYIYIVEANPQNKQTQFKELEKIQGEKYLLALCSFLVAQEILYIFLAMFKLFKHYCYNFFLSLHNLYFTVSTFKRTFIHHPNSKTSRHILSMLPPSGSPVQSPESNKNLWLCLPFRSRLLLTPSSVEGYQASLPTYFPITVK